MQKLITVLLALVACACSMPFDRQFPWWTSGKTEGDIELHPSQVGKNGHIDSKLLWPNATVYYIIEPIYTDDEKKTIMEAFDEYHTRTCIRFVERTDQENFVAIGNKRGGCYSKLGMLGGEQWLNLAPMCLDCGPKIAIHELLHTIGFWHQHSAPSRDDWVTIEWQNIVEPYVGQFEKYNSSIATEFGVEYDYDSIMHYDTFAISKNGKKTIVPKKDPNAQIGKATRLSDKDILKLHRMYKCE